MSLRLADGKKRVQMERGFFWGQILGDTGTKRRQEMFFRGLWLLFGSPANKAEGAGESISAVTGYSLGEVATFPTTMWFGHS